METYIWINIRLGNSFWLTAQSHHLNQCWLIIKSVNIPHRTILQKGSMKICNICVDYTCRITMEFPRGQGVKIWKELCALMLIHTLYLTCRWLHNTVLTKIKHRLDCELAKSSFIVLIFRVFWRILTHWDQDKMDPISQMTFSSAFRWTKIL